MSSTIERVEPKFNAFPINMEFSAGGRKRPNQEHQLKAGNFRKHSDEVGVQTAQIKKPPEGRFLFGCPTSPTRKKSDIHDIIEFFELSQDRIYEISAPLCRDGLSITEIAEQTGLKRTAIWQALKTHQDQLHPKPSVPYKRWRKGHKRTGARPPYGFCFLQGEVVRDPKEYPTLLLIHNLWTRGGKIMSILAALSDKSLKSRTGREWSYGVIKAIVKRIDSGAIVLRAGKLVLSEAFLEGMSSQSNTSTKKKKR